MTAANVLGLVVALLICVYLSTRCCAGRTCSPWHRASCRSRSSARSSSPSCRCSAATWRGSSRPSGRSSTPSSGPVERLAYRLLRVDPERGQDWKAYAKSLIVFSLLGWLVLFVILRTQTLHPFYTGGFHSGTWDLSFNTASSFVTNTNWQFYGGETTLTYFSQMAGLAVQNFVSAAVGIAVAIALIRGLVARRSDGDTEAIGNFWQDLTRARSTCCCRSRSSRHSLLVSQGVLQTLGGARRRPGRAARSPRRRRSRSSAPTAAASSTSTPRSRSRTRRVLEPRRDVPHPLHPGVADLHLRAHGRQPPPGLGDLLGDVAAVLDQRRRRVRRRAPRHARPAASAGVVRRREPRGQGAALRHRRAPRCGPRSRRSRRAARSTRRSSR